MGEEKIKRKNTKLQSEGAEFLVLGNLLLNGIPSYKTYTNMPGYDLVATNPEKNTSVMIQVKSRYQTNWDGFIIKNFESDFVVLVTLNRGFPKMRKNEETGIKDPNFFIFPIEYVKSISTENSAWGKITKAKMTDFEKYENRWDLIIEKLNKGNN